MSDYCSRLLGFSFQFVSVCVYFFTSLYNCFLNAKFTRHCRSFRILRFFRVKIFPIRSFGRSMCCLLSVGCFFGGWCCGGYLFSDVELNTVPLCGAVVVVGVQK